MVNLSSQTKIVLLTDWLADLEGGAEKQIFELAQRLDKEKYSVSVVSLAAFTDKTRERFKQAGCPLELFPVRRIYGFSGFFQGLRFFKFLKRRRIDILLTYHFGSDVWGTFWGHFAGVRAVISNRRDMGYWRAPQHVKVYRLINRWVDRIVVVANAVRDIVLREEDFSVDKMITIYNGVEISTKTARDPEEVKKELGILPDESVVVHVANLRPVKGHSYLLSALAQLIKPFPKIKLVLIGDDGLNGELQRSAAELNIASYIVFAGKRRDVQDILKIADICVLPSLSEGMSNAILEYMAAGKPVIATRVGGNPELVRDGFNGILVEKENAAQLRNALMMLLKDMHICQAMGQNGLARARTQFSMATMVGKYSELFNSLVPPHSKIVHFISSGGMYGAEHVLLSLAGELKKRGVPVVIAALDDQRAQHLEILEQAKEQGIETLRLSSRGKWDLSPIGQLREYFKKNRVAVLHTHNYKSDLIGLVAAWFSHVPVVATAHGFTAMSRSVKFYERLDRFVLSRFFKKVVVVADNILPGMSAAKRKLISNGFDLARFQRNDRQRSLIRQSFQVQPEEVLIGTVGRLSPEKNQTMLIDAAVQIVRKFANVKFIVVGDGPERDALRQKVKKLELTERFFFAGFTKDVASFYSAMDIFVLPSKTEGIPLTLLEAMAHQLPVIVTKVGGVGQIVAEGKTGFLVPAQNISEFIKKLEYLIANRSLWPEYGRAAREAVKRDYSLEAMVSKYEAVYAEAADSY